MKPGPKQTEDPTSSATSPSLPTRPHHVKTSTKGPWAASPSPTPTHFHQPHLESSKVSGHFCPTVLEGADLPVPGVLAPG